MAAFTASVPRQNFEEGEFINLTLTTDRRNQGSPDLSALQQSFDIINQSQSSKITQINGRLDVNIEWRIELLPKTTGKLLIPALTLGGEKTQPITLTIQKARTPQLSPSGQSTTSTAPLPELFLTLRADDKTPYVQQEVLLTLTIHHKRPLQSGQLSQLELPNAIITEIKEQTEDKKLIQGQPFNTLTVHYLITPQKSGSMAVGPVRLVAELAGNAGSGSGFRSRFFNRSDRRVSSSDTLTLDVLPKPANYPKNAAWLPAKSIILADDWSENSATATIGEAITRSVSLTVAGQTARILPEFTYPPQANAKVYADQSHTEEQTTKQGTVSQKAFSIAIVPTAAGTISLPAQTLVWWNVVTDRLERLTLPGKTWSVSGAGASKGATAANPSATVLTESTVTQTAPTTPAIDNNANPQADAFSEQPPLTQFKTPAWIKFLLLLLLVLWVGTCGLVWALYRKLKSLAARLQSQATTAHIAKNIAPTHTWKQAKKAVIQTAEQEAVDQLIPAIIIWAKLHWQDKQLTALGHVISRAKGTPLERSLQALALNRYHPNPKVAPDFKGIIAAITPLKGPVKLTTNTARRQNALAPLHPATMAQP